MDATAPVAKNLAISPFTCGCEPEERSCLGGPNEGMLWSGDDSSCSNDGTCDAGSLAGLTAEEEMFILLGAYDVEAP